MLTRAGLTENRSENTTVPARGKALVQTGLKVSVPSGTYGRIAPRSGLGPFSPLPLSFHAASLTRITPLDHLVILNA